MSVIGRIAEILAVPAANAAARGLGLLFRKKPVVTYSREPGTRRWIARCEGYEGRGDTRRAAVVQLEKALGRRL